MEFFSRKWRGAGLGRLVQPGLTRWTGEHLLAVQGGPFRGVCCARRLLRVLPCRRRNNLDSKGNRGRRSWYFHRDDFPRRRDRGNAVHTWFLIVSNELLTADDKTLFSRPFATLTQDAISAVSNQPSAVSLKHKIHSLRLITLHSLPITVFLLFFAPLRLCEEMPLLFLITLHSLRITVSCLCERTLSSYSKLSKTFAYPLLPGAAGRRNSEEP